MMLLKATEYNLQEMHPVLLPYISLLIFPSQHNYQNLIYIYCV
jgi:hypothetical protein